MSDQITIFGVSVAVDTIYEQLKAAQRRFRKQVKLERERQERRERALVAAMEREEAERREAREEAAGLAAGPSVPDDDAAEPGEHEGGKPHPGLDPGEDDSDGSDGSGLGSESSVEDVDAFFDRNRIQHLEDDDESGSSDASFSEFKSPEGSS